MVSRKEVADKAGVSVATVSYVMNNKGGVSDEVRSRVQAVIEQLGYKPSHAARALKMKKTNCLAVFVNYLGDPFEAGLLNTMERHARRQGYYMYFHTYQADQEKEFLQHVSGRIDGLLLLGQTLKRETIAALQAQGVPIVSAMEPVEAAGIAAFVDIDWEAGMRQLIGHLVQQGHRKIGFMANGSARHSHELRKRAFLAVMRDMGMFFDEHSLLCGSGRLEQAEAEMERYLGAAHSDAPSAWIAASDLMAVGMLAACRRRGVEVPGQLALTGCEHILMAAQTTPAMTVLQCPRPEIATAAIERMVRILGGEQVDSVKLDAPLLVRGSSRL